MSDYTKLSAVFASWPQLSIDPTNSGGKAMTLGGIWFIFDKDGTLEKIGSQGVTELWAPKSESARPI